MGSRRSTCVTTPSSSHCLHIANSEALRGAINRNFVFSPWSIQLGLSLLANYSTGSDKQILLKFLNAENLDNLNTCNKQLLDSLTRIDEESAASINAYNKESLDEFSDDDELIENYVPSEGSVLLKFAGGVWVDQSLGLDPTLKTIAEDIYKGSAETVDFKDEAKHKEIVDGANRWAEEATNGCIKSVLSEHFITKFTRILLGNALYFRGKWDEVFYKSLTRDHKFYLLDGNVVDVPFMSSSDDERQWFIYDSEDFKILTLPYLRSSIAMHIILPSTGDMLLPLLEKVVSDPTFMDRHARKWVTVGAFRIPKFKIDYEFEVTESLKHVIDCQRQRVIHKSRIEIDEKGTEAAAVTIIHGLEVAAGGPDRTAPVDFVADHPFIYMVRDYKSGTVLFMGHVVNPLM